MQKLVITMEWQGAWEEAVAQAQAPRAPARQWLGKYTTRGSYAGLVRGKAGDEHLYLVTAQPASPLTWDEARQWAADRGLDTRLPTRKEQALLFANLGERFEKEWYWSEEQCVGVPKDAWCQFFLSGYQFYQRKSSPLHVVAVRTLPADGPSLG